MKEESIYKFDGVLAQSTGVCQKFSIASETWWNWRGYFGNKFERGISKFSLL